MKRREYFNSPQAETKIEKIVPSADGTIEMRFSFGTGHEQHLGLDERQKKKLDRAIRHKVRIMRMTTWLGLPCPILEYAASFVSDSDEQLHQRDQCRTDLQYELNQRNLGQFEFRNLDGWAEKEIPLNDYRLAPVFDQIAIGVPIAKFVAAQDRDKYCGGDASACFFEHFPMKGIFRRLAGFDAASGKAPTLRTGFSLQKQSSLSVVD